MSTSFTIQKVIYSTNVKYLAQISTCQHSVSAYPSVSCVQLNGHHQERHPKERADGRQHSRSQGLEIGSFKSDPLIWKSLQGEKVRRSCVHLSTAIRGTSFLGHSMVISVCLPIQYRLRPRAHYSIIFLFALRASTYFARLSPVKQN